jgi:hypothetical protein
MAHIQNTLQRKKAVVEASYVDPTLKKYRNSVDLYVSHGYSKPQIIAELLAEKERILGDNRKGDAIFHQGLANVKNSCVKAIDLIVSELNGEI